MAQYRINRPINIGGTHYRIGETIEEGLLLAGRTKALIQAGLISVASEATLVETESSPCIFITLPDGTSIVADGIDVEIALALLSIENQRAHAEATADVVRPAALALALVAERRKQPRIALENRLEALTTKALGGKIEAAEAQEGE